MYLSNCVLCDIIYSNWFLTFNFSSRLPWEDCHTRLMSSSKTQSNLSNNVSWELQGKLPATLKRFVQLVFFFFADLFLFFWTFEVIWRYLQVINSRFTYDIRRVNRLFYLSRYSTICAAGIKIQSITFKMKSVKLSCDLYHLLCVEHVTWL